jgi:hypothetical protein
MRPKKPTMTKVDNPTLIKTAANLSSTGHLAISTEKYVYLDIDNNYIHELFPLLQDNLIQKPDYFSKYTMGAHITVFYPEENIIINQEDLESKHSFSIKNLYTAILNSKKYYIITIECPTLLELREKYGLTEMLNFKGY